MYTYMYNTHILNMSMNVYANDKYICMCTHMYIYIYKLIIKTSLSIHRSFDSVYYI